MLRWNIRKKTIVGTAAMAEAAMIRFSGVSAETCQMPTFSVSLVGLYPYSTSNGPRKSFHTATSPKSAAEPGPDAGQCPLPRLATAAQTPLRLDDDLRVCG
jgi:hypothetical protein